MKYTLLDDVVVQAGMSDYNDAQDVLQEGF